MYFQVKQDIQREKNVLLNFGSYCMVKSFSVWQMVEKGLETAAENLFMIMKTNIYFSE